MRVIIKLSVHFNMMIYLLVDTVIYAFGSLTSSTEKRQANCCDQCEQEILKVFILLMNIHE